MKKIKHEIKIQTEKFQEDYRTLMLAQNILNDLLELRKPYENEISCGLIEDFHREIRYNELTLVIDEQKEKNAKIEKKLIGLIGVIQELEKYDEEDDFIIEDWRFTYEELGVHL